MRVRGVLLVAVLAVAVAAVVLILTRTGAPAAAPAPLAATPAAPGRSADAAAQLNPTGVRATVVGVADPVTIDVRLPGREVVRVRALGIQPAGECYADQSVAFARRILGTAAVRLVPDPVGPATDPFDRRLVHVMLDEADYAVLAAEAGVARTYSAGASESAMPPVRDAEQRAREAGRGLWASDCR